MGQVVALRQRRAAIVLGEDALAAGLLPVRSAHVPQSGVHLYALAVDDPAVRSAINRAALADILSPDERARGRIVGQAAWQDMRLASRLLLRLVLSAHEPGDPAAWQFERGPYGRPMLAGGAGPRFSVSRPPGMAIVALSESGEVGVDLDMPSRVRRALLGQTAWLTERELDTLNSRTPADLERDLTTRWTMKEALLKGLGRGLTMPPDHAGFDLYGEAITAHAVSPDLPDLAAWRFDEIDAGPLYRGALASRPAG